MNNTKPLLGLLTFTFHAASSSLMLVLPLILLVGVVAQITEIALAVQLFPFMAVGAAPYIVLMKSEGTAKWEPYQIAMPVKRKHMVTALFSAIFISSLMWIPIIGAVWGVGLIFSDVVVESIFYGGYISIAYVYGTALLTAAIIYPLACTKLGQRSEAGLMLISMIAAVAILGGIAWLGYPLGLANSIVSLLIIAISGVAFIVSLFVTRAIYAKIDF